MPRIVEIPTSKNELYREIKRVLDTKPMNAIFIWEDEEAQRPFYYPCGEINDFLHINGMLDAVKFEIWQNGEEE